MLSLALAGKPNAGKSTFYTAATMADVDVANYPFTTVDPNRGVATVRTECPCLELDERCDNDRCRDGTRYVPIELLDVAGLVPGAHEGRGLGNQFLDELTTADAILNVLDASGSTNAEGEPVEAGSHDPVEDVEFIEQEMNQWLAGIIESNWESVERKSRSPEFDINNALSELLTGFGASVADVAACLRSLAYPEDPIQWTDSDREALAEAVRERTKPIILVANKVDVADDETLQRLQAAAEIVIPATADGELALRRGVEAGVVDYKPGDDEFEITGDISESQQAGLERIREVIDEYGGTGVQRALNTAVTTCWTISPPIRSKTRPNGSTARATCCRMPFCCPRVDADRSRGGSPHRHRRGLSPRGRRQTQAPHLRGARTRRRRRDQDRQHRLMISSSA